MFARRLMNDHQEPVTLCLSGGGYRAAIFHLGALRWLNQCGVLPNLSRICCVSGGSNGADLDLHANEQQAMRISKIRTDLNRFTRPESRFCRTTVISRRRGKRCCGVRNCCTMRRGLRICSLPIRNIGSTPDNGIAGSSAALTALCRIGCARRRVSGLDP